MKAPWKAVTYLVLAVVIALIAGASPRVVQAEGSWQGSYYANRSLAGSPVMVRQDGAINFDWGTGSPGPYVPADDFSVRWEGFFYLENGHYRFSTTTDDGVRLYVDGYLLIDRWYDMAPTTFSAEIDLLTGWHTIRMEYYEHRQLAIARLWWETSGGWRGEYYNNRDLSGSPTLIRYDQAIDFDWGYGSPDYRIASDNFSVRWTGTIGAESERYTFYVLADDGVRLWVDGRLLIDDWRDSTGDLRQATTDLYGFHTLRLEYYEHLGRARVKLWWEGEPNGERPVGNVITCVRPRASWIKIYRKLSNGSWQDMNPQGWGPLDKSGFLKIDGLPVDDAYGGQGHPYRVELWADGSLIRSIGHTGRGEPEFRVFPFTDNRTPWACPAP